MMAPMDLIWEFGPVPITPPPPPTNLGGVQRPVVVDVDAVKGAAELGPIKAVVSPGNEVGE